MALEECKEEQTLEKLKSWMDEMEEIVGLKCDICNCEFKDSTVAEIHAKNEGHSSFSEVTMFIPNLKARLESIRTKLDAKSKLEEKESLEEEKRKEIARRTSGKADLETKRIYKERQITDSAEKMRQERNEDKNALSELRKKLKEEKEDRKRARLSQEHFTTESFEIKEEGQQQILLSSLSSKLQRIPDKIRIQIKNLKDSTKITESFHIESKLSQLISWMEENNFIIQPTSSLYMIYPQRINFDLHSLVSQEKSLMDHLIIKSSTLLFDQ